MSSPTVRTGPGGSYANRLRGTVRTTRNRAAATTTTSGLAKLAPIDEYLQESNSNNNNNFGHSSASAVEWSHEEQLEALAKAEHLDRARIARQSIKQTLELIKDGVRHAAMLNHPGTEKGNVNSKKKKKKKSKATRARERQSQDALKRAEGEAQALPMEQRMDRYREFLTTTSAKQLPDNLVERIRESAWNPRFTGSSNGEDSNSNLLLPANSSLPPLRNGGGGGGASLWFPSSPTRRSRRPLVAQYDRPRTTSPTYAEQQQLLRDIVLDDDDAPPPPQPRPKTSSGDLLLPPAGSRRVKKEKKEKKEKKAPPAEEDPAPKQPTPQEAAAMAEEELAATQERDTRRRNTKPLPKPAAILIADAGSDFVDQRGEADDWIEDDDTKTKEDVWRRPDQGAKRPFGHIAFKHTDPPEHPRWEEPDALLKRLRRHHRQLLHLRRYFKRKLRASAAFRCAVEQESKTVEHPNRNVAAGEHGPPTEDETSSSQAKSEIPSDAFVRSIREALQQFVDIDHEEGTTSTAAAGSGSSSSSASTICRWFFRLPDQLAATADAATGDDSGPIGGVSSGLKDALQYSTTAPLMARSMVRKLKHIYTVMLQEEQQTRKKNANDNDGSSTTSTSTSTSTERTSWMSNFETKLVEMSTALAGDDASRRSVVDATLGEYKSQLTINKQTPWVVNAWRNDNEPREVVFEHLPVLFFYTVDPKACDCGSINACEATRAEESAEESRLKDEAAKKAEDDPNGEKMKVDIRKHQKKPPSIPKAMNAVVGYNPAPWAAMNWALRVAEEATDKNVAAGAKAAVALFKEFRNALTTALRVFPNQPRVTFRGLGFQVSELYTLNTNVKWPSFSSTSTIGEASLAFMNKHKPGTFFVIRIFRVPMIHFSSWYPDQLEALLHRDTHLKVKIKVPGPVMRLIGWEADIVVLEQQLPPSEAGQLTTQDRIHAVKESTRPLTFLFDEFMGSYVDAPVSTTAIKSFPSRFVQQLMAWITATDDNDDGGAHGDAPAGNNQQQLQREEHGIHRARDLVIMGPAGNGKTSAAVAAWSWIGLHRTAATPPAAGAAAEKKDGAAYQQLVPIFVWLPGVKGLTTVEGALDEYVRHTTGLDEETFKQLLEEHNVVLILDSLDEACGLTTEFLSERQLFKLNPILGSCSGGGGGTAGTGKKNRLRCLLTFRDEMTTARAITVHPSKLLAEDRTSSVLYLQEFSMNDAKQLVANRCNEAGVPEAAGPIINNVARAVPIVRRSPFNLSIFVQLEITEWRRHHQAASSSSATTSPPFNSSVPRKMTLTDLLELGLKDHVAKRHGGDQDVGNTRDDEDDHVGDDGAVVPAEEHASASSATTSSRLTDAEWATFFTACGRIALEMFNRDEYVIAATDVDAILRAPPAAHPVRIEDLPSRADNFKEPSAVFSWKHKRFAEFLLAHYLWTSTAATATTTTTTTSTNTTAVADFGSRLGELRVRLGTTHPLVLGHFRDFARRDPQRMQVLLEEVLLPIITATTSASTAAATTSSSLIDSSNTTTVSAAAAAATVLRSNAITIAAAARCVIRGARLPCTEGADLGGLTLIDCNIDVGCDSDNDDDDHGADDDDGRRKGRALFTACSTDGCTMVRCSGAGESVGDIAPSDKNAFRHIAMSDLMIMDKKESDDGTTNNDDNKQGSSTEHDAAVLRPLWASDERGDGYVGVADGVGDGLTTTSIHIARPSLNGHVDPQSSASSAASFQLTTVSAAGRFRDWFYIAKNTIVALNATTSAVSLIQWDVPANDIGKCDAVVSSLSLPSSLSNTAADGDAVAASLVPEALLAATASTLVVVLLSGGGATTATATATVVLKMGAPVAAEAEAANSSREELTLLKRYNHHLQEEPTTAGNESGAAAAPSLARGVGAFNRAAFSTDGRTVLLASSSHHCIFNTTTAGGDDDDDRVARSSCDRSFCITADGERVFWHSADVVHTRIVSQGPNSRRRMVGGLGPYQQVLDIALVLNDTLLAALCTAPTVGPSPAVLLFHSCGLSLARVVQSPHGIASSFFPPFVSSSASSNQTSCSRLAMQGGSGDAQLHTLDLSFLGRSGVEEGHGSAATITAIHAHHHHQAAPLAAASSSSSSPPSLLLSGSSDGTLCTWSMPHLLPVDREELRGRVAVTALHLATAATTTTYVAACNNKLVVLTLGGDDCSNDATSTMRTMGDDEAANDADDAAGVFGQHELPSQAVHRQTVRCLRSVMLPPTPLWSSNISSANISGSKEDAREDDALQLVVVSADDAGVIAVWNTCKLDELRLKEALAAEGDTSAGAGNEDEEDGSSRRPRITKSISSNGDAELRSRYTKQHYLRAATTCHEALRGVCCMEILSVASAAEMKTSTESQPPEEAETEAHSSSGSSPSALLHHLVCAHRSGTITIHALNGPDLPQLQAVQLSPFRDTLITCLSLRVVLPPHQTHQQPEDVDASTSNNKQTNSPAHTTALLVFANRSCDIGSIPIQIPPTPTPTATPTDPSPVFAKEEFLHVQATQVSEVVGLELLSPTILGAVTAAGTVVMYELRQKQTRHQQQQQQAATGTADGGDGVLCWVAVASGELPLCADVKGSGGAAMLAGYSTCERASCSLIIAGGGDDDDGGGDGSVASTTVAKGEEQQQIRADGAEQKQQHQCGDGHGQEQDANMCDEASAAAAAASPSVLRHHLLVTAQLSSGTLLTARSTTACIGCCGGVGADDTTNATLLLPAPNASKTASVLPFELLSLRGDRGGGGSIINEATNDKTTLPIIRTNDDEPEGKKEHAASGGCLEQLAVRGTTLVDLAGSAL